MKAYLLLALLLAGCSTEHTTRAPTGYECHGHVHRQPDGTLIDECEGQP